VVGISGLRYGSGEHRLDVFSCSGVSLAEEFKRYGLRFAESSDAVSDEHLYAPRCRTVRHRGGRCHTGSSPPAVERYVSDTRRHIDEFCTELNLDFTALALSTGCWRCGSSPNSTEHVGVYADDPMVGGCPRLAADLRELLRSAAGAGSHIEGIATIAFGQRWIVD
jgi:hypothetical protein